MENKEEKAIVPEEEIKLKKPKVDEKELEIQRLRAENEDMKRQLIELENYIREQKKPQQQSSFDNPIVGAVIKAIVDKFTESKGSDLDALLFYQEKARALREAMRSPIEDELLRNSLEMQKAALEAQKTNLQLQQFMMKNALKALGVPVEEKKKTLNIKIPPEAFEHE
ncbi:MAG: hypothetical protein QW622_03405 [Candidatus Pacearchaeota archaeon]